MLDCTLNLQSKKEKELISRQWGEGKLSHLSGKGWSTYKNEISRMTTYLNCKELSIFQNKLCEKPGLGRLVAKGDTVQTFH